MRETPAAFQARTGAPPPTTDVRIAGDLLGTSPRPPDAEEPCPTLFRDVGPQALSLFLDGALTRLEGNGSSCTFLRDATLPGFSNAAREFGVLVVLQPLALGPWMSGQSGIWVAECGRLPSPGTLALVPGDLELPEVDAKLVDVGTGDALREALGGVAYDDRVARIRIELQQYLEDWRGIERLSGPIRAALDSNAAHVAEATRAILADAGLTEKDLRAPWFHLDADRRAFVRGALPDVAIRIRS